MLLSSPTVGTTFSCPIPVNRRKNFHAHHVLCVSNPYFYISWLTTDFKLNSDELLHNKSGFAATKLICYDKSTAMTLFFCPMLDNRKKTHMGVM